MGGQTGGQQRARPQRAPSAPPAPRPPPGVSGEEVLTPAGPDATPFREGRSSSREGRVHPPRSQEVRGAARSAETHGAGRAPGRGGAGAPLWEGAGLLGLDGDSCPAMRLCLMPPNRALHNGENGQLYITVYHKKKVETKRAVTVRAGAASPTGRRGSHGVGGGHRRPGRQADSTLTWHCVREVPFCERRRD